MSATPGAPAQTSQASIKAGQVLLAGRITAVRKAGQSFIHLLVLPAPDAYSSPSTVEIIADKRLGDAAADARILCRVGGFRRQYKATDKDTGEIRQVTTADNKLFGIEAV